MCDDRSKLWLVAEDSEDDFMLLECACSRLKQGPKLQRAKNGAEAQSYLAGEEPFTNREVYPSPATVVSDLNMPLMNAPDLLTWFKTQAGLQGIPFVLLNSSNDQRDRDRALQLGVDEFLIKPSRFEDLITMVAGISDQHWYRKVAEAGVANSQWLLGLPEGAIAIPTPLTQKRAQVLTLWSEIAD